MQFIMNTLISIQIKIYIQFDFHMKIHDSWCISAALSLGRVSRPVQWS